MARATRVALALGSGGARGYAHIGVIQVLEERGYDIVGIAGTSMGAVVGGLHAAGQLQAYADWVSTLTQRAVLRLLDPTLTSPGVIRAEKILAEVSELLGEVRIEQLPVPFTAVATDLLARREVWFQQGPLDAAIRASIALPSVITPVVLNGRLLADGGLMNPIPIAPTAAVTADLTVAVALSEEHLAPSGAVPVQESAEPCPSEEWLERTRRSASQVLDRERLRAIASWLAGDREAGSDEEEQIVGRLGEAAEAAAGAQEEPYGELPSGLGTLDVMQLSLDALQSVVTRYRLAGYPPDLMITVPRTSCRTLDFHRAGEMIALGRDLGTEALDRFEAGDP